VELLVPHYSIEACGHVTFTRFNSGKFVNEVSKTIDFGFDANYSEDPRDEARANSTYYWEKMRVVLACPVLDNVVRTDMTKQGTR
jgi:hypothetical protein